MFQAKIKVTYTNANGNRVTTTRQITDGVQRGALLRGEILLRGMTYDIEMVQSLEVRGYAISVINLGAKSST